MLLKLLVSLLTNLLYAKISTSTRLVCHLSKRTVCSVACTTNAHTEKQRVLRHCSQLTSFTECLPPRRPKKDSVLFLGPGDSHERAIPHKGSRLLTITRSNQSVLNDHLLQAAMKVFSNAVTFNYSWDEVSTANWRKYGPWNNKSEHVIAVDTISRSVDPSTGILRTERLITCRQSAPDWMKTVIGNCMDESFVYEASYVDPLAKTVTMVSQNLTWSNLVSVQEEVVYRPLGDNRTQFAQTARITALCGGWQRIKNKIEDSLVNRFRENAVKGREGFERVLEMSRLVFAEEKERQQREEVAIA